MRFLAPLLLLLLGAATTREETIKVPGAPVTVLGTSKFTEDDEFRYEVSRKTATIKSVRSYVAEYEDTLSIVATVTEFGKMKFNRDRLRFSFASTVWDYETDTTDKQEILEEKETTFGNAPAFYVKMKVKPENEDAYLFEGYMVSVDNKEVFLTVVYYDTADGVQDLNKWTDSILVEGQKRGEMKEIREDE